MPTYYVYSGEHQMFGNSGTIISEIRISTFMAVVMILTRLIRYAHGDTDLWTSDLLTT